MASPAREPSPTASIGTSIPAPVLWLVLLGASGWLLAQIGTIHPWAAVDDAFITYRYANNLRRGLGLVYNPGEAVLGTTAPLYALLLAGVGRLLPGAEMATIGLWISGVAWVATGWMAARFLGKPQERVAALAGVLLVLTQPQMLTHLGMETPLVLLWMLGAAWAWREGHRTWAVVFSAALVLTRLDGALWVCLLGLEAWRRERRFPWAEAGATLLLCMPWFLYAWGYYGSILPNSVVAKVGQLQRMPVGNRATPWQWFWTLLTGPGTRIQAGAMVGLVLAGLGYILVRRRDLWWLVAWGALYLTIYQMLRVVNFTWYFLPPLMVANLVAGLGLDGLLRAISRLRFPSHRLRSMALFVAGLALLGLPLWARGDAVGEEHARLRRDRVELHPYHAAGQWLATHARPQDVTLTIEIGIIGYHAPTRILDAMGLVSPASLPYLTGWMDSLVYPVSQHWPEYAITLPRTAWERIVPLWWFQKHYRKVAQFEYVSIYRRIALPTYTYSVPLGARYRTGLEVVEAAFQGPTIRPGEPLDGTLVLRVHAPQPAELQFLWTWIGADGSRVGQEVAWPFALRDAWPAVHWPTGATIAVPVRLQVPSELESGPYRLGLVMYRVDTGDPLSLVGAEEDALSEVVFGDFQVAGR